MKKCPLLFAGTMLLCLAGLPSGRAADPEKPPLPSGPLLQPAADYSVWQINYAYVSDKAKPASSADPSAVPGADAADKSRVRQIIIERTRPWWHSVTTDVAGHKSEEWFNGVGASIKDAGDKNVMVINTQDPLEQHTDYSRVSFPGMDLVAPPNYSGVQKIEGHDCLVFTKGGTAAWIDLGTRWPVRWAKDGETRTFVQLDAPTNMLAMPPEVTKMSEAIKRDLEILRRPIPRGG